MPMFLSKDNFQHVFEVCKSFLNDVLRIQVEDTELHGIVANEMTNVHALQQSKSDASSKALPTDVLNKTVIINVRKRLASAKPPAQQEEQQEAAEGDEQVFFKRLKNLEIQRSLVTATTITENTTTPPPQPHAIHTALQPQTIIVKENGVGSMIERGTKHLWVVCSQDRLWMYEHRRNPFIITKDIDKRVDNMSLKVCSAIIPILQHNPVHPFYYLCFEGAGKQNVEIPLYVTNTHGGYIHLACPSPDAAHIPTLSMPWTLTLLDPFRREVDIGIDGWQIRSATYNHSGDTTIYVLDASIQNTNNNLHHHFDINDEIQVCSTNSENIFVRLKSVNTNTLEVYGHGPHTGCIINTLKQCTVFIEWVEKNDT